LGDERAMLDDDLALELEVESASAHCDDTSRTKHGPDPAVRALHGGGFFNSRLGAPNVWEVDVELSLVDEAASIFDGAKLRQAHKSLRGARGVPIQSFEGGGASFAVVQPKGWFSDINWFSVDDEATMARFESIFTRLDLVKRFAPVVEHTHTLRMYSALFLVRTQCSEANVHSDWVESLGANALTLITPLVETKCAVDDNGGFQLVYKGTGGPAGAETEALHQYTYTRGKAIVFGASFKHSTEPGRAASAAEPHVYLCLTFGTDDLERWPAIADKGLRDQSRLLARPDGSYERTGLGERTQDNSLDLIRRAIAAM
jgi:hypothetical protein